MKRRFAALIAGLAVLSTACFEVVPVEVSVTAEARPEALQGARWAELPVRYCIAAEPGGFTSPEEFASLTEQAFATWGIATVNEGLCQGRAGERDGINQVGWGKPPAAQGGSHEAGYTRIIFQECRNGCPNGAQNRIVEADIIISDSPPERWQSAECLSSVLLHETGHFLGVPHLDSPAIMAPASSSCSSELTQPDIDTLAALYAG